MTSREVWNRGGVWWNEAPLPPADHECWAQTTGFIQRHVVERCACGGIRYDAESWMDRNSRRQLETPKAARKRRWFLWWTR